MLIAAATLFFVLFFGGSHDATGVLEWIAIASACTDDYVPEVSRREKAKAIFTEMHDEFVAFQKKAAELRAVFQRLDAEWLATQKRIVDLRFELKNWIRAPEWKALFRTVEAKVGGDL